MKLFDRIRRLFQPAPVRISRHILRDIGQDPLALRYASESRSAENSRPEKDPWCLAS